MESNLKIYYDQIKHAHFNKSIYFLGNFEKRITVYSQQIRALNLIYSLHKVKILTKDSRIAIIGGGISGLMTAYAAAVLKTKNIDIYEQTSSLLSIWRNSRVRWLHPNVFKWPFNQWDWKETRLPFLNWTEGMANDVAEQLLDQWEIGYSIYQEQIEINVYNDIKVKIFPDGNVKPKGKIKKINYDLIFIAVGFGRDGNSNDSETCYWANDNIEVLNSTIKRYFLSGNGDGGVSDLLRIRVKHFSKDLLLSWLNSKEFEAIREKIMEAEEELIRLRISNGDKEAHDYIQNVYSNLKTPKFDNTLDLRIDTKCYFHTKTRFMYNLDCFPLNRFLLSRLLFGLDTKTIHKYGEILNLDKLKSCNDKNIDVVFESGEVIQVDNFITRHGPISPLKEDSYNWIFESNQDEIKRNLNSLDQTGSIKIWDDDAFKQHNMELEIIAQENSLVKIAVAIIRHNRSNRYLITRRRNIEGEFEWSFVGKRIRPFHIITKAIEEECFNEVNISCKVESKLGSRIHPVTKKFVEYYFCKHISGKAIVKDTRELAEVKWATPIKILELTKGQISDEIFSKMQK